MVDDGWSILLSPDIRWPEAGPGSRIWASYLLSLWDMSPWWNQAASGTNTQILHTHWAVSLLPIITDPCSALWRRLTDFQRKYCGLCHGTIQFKVKRMSRLSRESTSSLCFLLTPGKIWRKISSNILLLVLKTANNSKELGSCAFVGKELCVEQ